LLRYKITGSTPNHPHFNLPHFSLFSLFPSPSPSFLMGSWLAQYFLAVKVAFGIGGQLEVILLALLKGYEREGEKERGREGERRGEKGGEKAGEMKIKEERGIKNIKSINGYYYY
jgi:hypothetical protein